MDALTKGAGSAPIEMHAHDPLRYVGDQLAWLHVALASEKDILKEILGEHLWNLGIREVMSPVLRHMCSKVVATLQQPLRIITNFQVCDLLDFYQGLIENVVGTANEDGKEVQLPAMRGEGREEDDDLQELAATISIDALRELAGTKLWRSRKVCRSAKASCLVSRLLRKSVSIVEVTAELGKINRGETQ